MLSIEGVGSSSGVMTLGTHLMLSVVVNVCRISIFHVEYISALRFI